ncbi:hypothetical protein SLEP1_g46500 [Rubroshorea leprosula]|uniref:DELLA protein n=1 Tax=Rubroshorea leprosula TaxID=152421 RepID=A0AAV5LMH1_9ROSI|nr:hypothetical protein SLEP1_g46500 [Rubroshorea leprosula]
MKRDHHHLNPNPDTTTSGKVKLEEQDGGMDELLAVLGYKVRTSDMAQVAQKLEQLEEVMGNVQVDGMSHLASDTVHYNPSDLSTWVESMLSEFNPPTSFDSVLAAPPPPLSSGMGSSFSTLTSVDFNDNQKQQLNTPFFDESSYPDYELKAIPGKAVYSNTQTLDSSSSSNHNESSSNKRLKPSSGSNSETYPTTSMAPFGIPPDPTRPVVLVDSQENGIRLVHALLACAEAVQENNLTLARALVNQISYLAISQAGAMGKVATHFARALASRIYGCCPEYPLDHSLSDFLQMHFYETCPYLKFAHFTANQAILEAFEGKKRVHVIDFSMNQGMQWPALMQALALRPGGPPTFRLTGIGPPAPDNSDQLQEVGWKLAQLAKTIHVEFEYSGLARSLADLDASMLNLRPSEVESVAVNSVFELHKLLARPGAIEKALSVVKQMNPEIVTVVEQEANHNGPLFLDRFTESLHYYSTLFDSLEGSVNGQDKLMSEMYLGKQIYNVVACEGVDRVERHETLTHWRTRLGSSGFVPAHLGSNAFKQASTLLALFAGGDGYRVEENNGCLMLGWHTRPLIATSAWKLANKTVMTH